MKRKLFRLVIFFLSAALLLAPLSALAREPMAVTPMYQEDYTTPLFTWEGEEKSVATSGCAAACMAMVLSYYFPDEEGTDPESLMQLSFLNGLYQGNGLSINSIVTMLEEWGLTCKSVGADRNTIRRALYRDKLVIAYMGAGYFSSGGHYILLYGNHGDRRVWVIDPNSRKKSETHYVLENLFNEAGNNHAFLICSLPEEDAQ